MPVVNDTFETEVTVRFHEVDRAGIVFFGRVFEYFHIGWEELQIYLGLKDVFADEGWGMPLVHAEADFSRPMRLSERLRVCLSVEATGRSSLTFAFTIRGPDGDVRAVGRHVHAFADLKTMSSCPFPNTLADALRREGLIAN